MISSKNCLDTFGEPNVQMEYKHMTVWVVPADMREKIPCLPAKVYCNRKLVAPLERAIRNLINEGIADELKTWNGCFNIRKSRGLSSPSLHSWGIAVDVNAATNALGAEPTLSSCFVDCFKREGFDWGGEWKRKDGMHFQLSRI